MGMFVSFISGIMFTFLLLESANKVEYAHKFQKISKEMMANTWNMVKLHTHKVKKEKSK